MVRTLAMIFGVLYLAAGVLGFVPGMVEPMAGDHGELVVRENHGMLLGIFPVNAVHNAVHLLIGIWGLGAALGYSSSIMFFRGLAILYGLLGILGLIPQTQNLFGLAPLHGNDVWLHLGTALIAAIVGWGVPATRVATKTTAYEEDHRRAA
jgi:hypothetical protein